MNRLIYFIQLLFISLALPMLTQAQPIAVIAGMAGNPAYTGDGGISTTATIGGPGAMALDHEGNLYITDAINNVIRKVTPDGTIATIAGNGSAGYSGDGGAATSAELRYPQGIAIDTAGNIYIGDDSNFVVRKISTAGVITTFAGNGTYGYTGDGSAATTATLQGAFGVAADKKGNVYVADAYLYVRKIDASGIITTYAGSATYGYSGDGSAATSAALAAPLGLAADDTGNLFIADNHNNMVRRVDTFGIITTIAGMPSGGGGGPVTGGDVGDDGPATSARLHSPTNIATDKWGNLFIADADNSTIRRVAPTGIISLAAGIPPSPFVIGIPPVDGGTAQTTTFDFAYGVAIDSTGVLYIADRDNNVVYKMKSGSIDNNYGTTVCSGTPVTFTSTSPIGGAPFVYQWQVNGINTGTDSADFTTTTLNNGDTITCSLVFAGTNIIVSDTTTMSVIPSTPVAVSVTAPADTVCGNSSSTFTATGVNEGTAPVYIWSIDDAVMASGSSNTFTYAPTSDDLLTGTYTVKCTLASNAPCVATDSAISVPLIVTLIQTVTPTVTIAASGGDTLCTGIMAALSAMPGFGSGSAPTFRWLVNGVNAGAGGTFSYTPANGDLVTCVMTSNGCAATDTAMSNTLVLTVSPYVTPTLAIVTSDTACAGSIVVYSASAAYAGSAPVYNWIKNDVAVATGSSYSYMPANGDMISCILTSNALCTTTTSAKSDTLTMTVITPVAPTVSISGIYGDTVCAGTMETFIATAADGGTSPVYNWYRNGIYSAYGSSYTYTPLNGDELKCILMSAAACAIPDSAVSNIITMNVNPAATPAVTIAASTGDTICAGIPVTYTAIVANGGATPLYQWSVNGIDAGTAGTYTYSPVDGDSVACMLTSNALCATATVVSSSMIMTVASITMPAVSIAAAGGDTVCTGSSVTLTASSVNGGTAPIYQWKKNGVNTVTGSTYAYVPDSGDVITCVLTSNEPCASIDTAVSAAITITVGTFAAPALSIVTTGPVVCAGTEILYVAVATNGGTAPAYQWKVNDVNVSTEGLYIYVPANGDIISCVVTSNAHCLLTDTAASQITVVVTPTVTPTITITASTTTVSAIGEAITFTATVANGGTSPLYQWQINGDDIPGATSASFVVDTFTISEAVSCVITSDAPCAIVPVATSNHLGIEVTVGVKQILPDEEQLMLLPNPNNGSFTVKGLLKEATNSPISYKVTDLSGQILYDNSEQAQQGKIDKQINLEHGLPDGVYLLTVAYGSYVRVVNFIIQR